MIFHCTGMVQRSATASGSSLRTATSSCRLLPIILRTHIEESFTPRFYVGRLIAKPERTSRKHAPLCSQHGNVKASLDLPSDPHGTESFATSGGLLFGPQVFSNVEAYIVRFVPSLTSARFFAWKDVPSLSSIASLVTLANASTLCSAPYAILFT